MLTLLMCLVRCHCCGPDLQYLYESVRDTREYIETMRVVAVGFWFYFINCCQEEREDRVGKKEREGKLRER